MTNSKIMLAVGLAAATLVVFVAVLAMGGALQAGLAPWPGIGVAVLAVGAFACALGGADPWSRHRRRRIWLDKNGVLDGPLVFWPDPQNHPWSSDTRTSCGGGCWGHTGQKNEDCLTAVFSRRPESGMERRSRTRTPWRCGTGRRNSVRRASRQARGTTVRSGCRIRNFGGPREARVLLPRRALRASFPMPSYAAGDGFTSRPRRTYGDRIWRSSVRQFLALPPPALSSAATTMLR